jgi:hypothetical protein
MVNIKLAPKFWADRHKTPKFSGVLPFCIPIPKYSFIKLSFIKAKVQTVRTQINFIIEMKGTFSIVMDFGDWYKKELRSEETSERLDLIYFF